MPRERSFLLVALAGLISWSGDFVLGVGAGALADRIGIIPVIEVQGVAYVVAGAMVLAHISPMARQASRESAA